jgi:hypothetical protein
MIEGDEQLADEREIQQHRRQPVDVVHIAGDPSCAARLCQSLEAAPTIPTIDDPARAEVKELDSARPRSAERVEESFPRDRRPPIGRVEVSVTAVARDVDERALALRNPAGTST